MKRLVLLLLIAVLAVPAFGQYSRKPKKPTFAEHVWLGVNLTDFSFGNQSFSMGVTPMAGYYFTNSVSAGLMIKMAYRYQNFASSPPKIKFETFDLGPTVFLRLELKSLFPEQTNMGFLSGLFLQAEYEFGLEQVPQTDPTGALIIEDNKVLKETVQSDYVYLGAGFASGEGVQFCVSIHYNLLDNPQSIRNLWDYRFGVKWDLVQPGSDPKKKSSKRKR